MSIVNRNTLAFYLLVGGLLFCGLGPALWSDGMFMDGLIHAVIARNLAQGLGSFWSPYFSETILTPYYEHPPLALGLQAVFFKLLGDGHLTERLYSFLTCVTTAGLIILIWKWAGRKSASLTGWLPVFLWALVPLVHWTYPNNMLENTMGVFSALAVALAIRGMSHRQSLLWLWGAGSCVMLALLSKGPVGLFPLAVPLLYQVTHGTWRWSAWLKQMVWMLAGTLVPLMLLIILSAAARNSLHHYLNDQVLEGVLHVPTEPTRWYIMWDLLRELTPMLLVTGVLLWFSRKRKPAATSYRTALFFLLIGVSASFPIMLSLKQRAFYLVPSLPFFALAGASLIGPYIEDRIQRIRWQSRGARVFRGISWCVALIAVLVGVYSAGRVSRDHDKLATAYALRDLALVHTRINVCPAMGADWTLHGYLARYARLSIDRDPRSHHIYVLSDGSCTPDDSVAPSLDLPGTYALYQRAP